MATVLCMRPRALPSSSRAFSTSAPRAVSLQWERNSPEAIADTLPPYPHGPARWYKQSRLGLYGGQRIQFGNNVGDKIEVKSRRTWHPSILTRKLFSKSLDRTVQVRVSARVLRTIDKLGGLDEYLLGEKEGRIKALGESGWWLRWAIMQTQGVKKRFAAERERLGLPVQGKTSLDTPAVEAGIKAGIEDASEAELEAEGDDLGTDGAFEVEQTPGLAPLKFRVGPGKHVVLTPTGWRRTQSTNVAFKAKNKVKESLMANSETKRRVAYLEKAFKAHGGAGKLGEDGMMRLKQKVTKGSSAELEARAEEIMAKRAETKAERAWTRRHLMPSTSAAPQEREGGLLSLE